MTRTNPDTRLRELERRATQTEAEEDVRAWARQLGRSEGREQELELLDEWGLLTLAEVQEYSALLGGPDTSDTTEYTQADGSTGFLVDRLMEEISNHGFASEETGDGDIGHAALVHFKADELWEDKSLIEDATRYTDMPGLSVHDYRYLKFHEEGGAIVFTSSSGFKDVDFLEDEPALAQRWHEMVTGLTPDVQCVVCESIFDAAEADDEGGDPEDWTCPGCREEDADDQD